MLTFFSQSVVCVGVLLVSLWKAIFLCVFQAFYNIQVSRIQEEKNEESCSDSNSRSLFSAGERRFRTAASDSFHSSAICAEVWL